MLSMESEFSEERYLRLHFFQRLCIVTHRRRWGQFPVAPPRA
jgi:hypothetical protein